jgi:glyoxylase-like metal-dependent hydrolase (beta-lactamase superfamily II)
MGTTRFTIVNIGALSMNKFWGETERLHQTTATCTLLDVGGTRVLVDPSPYPEPLERKLFDTTGLRPEAIDQVFVTHFHGDHRFGLELFPNATWLMASAALDEWRERSPEEANLIDRFLPAEVHLPDSPQLYAAPGHTLGLHGLSVETPWGTLIVAGDAVMTPEFFEAEEGFHNSVDFAQATETIRAIKRVAALVIPGHGNIILTQRVERI